MRKILIFILFLTSCIPADRKYPPRAINGVLDLRTVPWDFATDGILNLDGKWEFYWQEFLQPMAPVLDRHAYPQFIQVPGSWNGTDAGTKEKPFLIGGDGYATYRLKILVAENRNANSLQKEYNTGLSLLLSTVGTAYKLFVNGKLMISVGETGPTAVLSKPAFHTQTIRIQETISGEYEIIVHVSNFHYAKGGLWNQIKIGTDKEISHLRENKLFFDFFLAGSVFFMGLYHLGLFSLRRKDRVTLWFGILCIIVTIRTMFTGEFSIYHFMPDFPWALGMKIEYLTWTLGMPFILLFTRNQFPAVTSQYIDRVFQGIFFLAALLVILLPPEYFTHTAEFIRIITLFILFHFVGILYRSMVMKQEGSVLFFISFIIFGATTINDLLYANLLIQTGYIVPFGLFVFLFFQTYLISSRFSRAFNQVEELSDSLEKKVISRTELLELARKKAEEANTLKDKFVSLISHDIRSPISGVYRILDRITGLDISKQKKEMGELLTLSKKSLALSLQMVEQVLDLSRIKSGKILPIYEKVDLSQIVSDVLSKISSQAEEKKITIINSILDSVFLYADPTLLGQIMLNLLSNAVKFSRAHDTIEIKYTRESKQHVITVSDTGTGINEGSLPNLFDATVKTSSTGTMGEAGSGLGLPLSHEMVQAMNGQITVQSVPDQGSNFRVFLPGAEKLVLVVDDNEIWRKEFRNILNNDNLIIQEAENGEAALAIMDKLWPDMIVTDLNMPVMDGFMLIQKIRENQEWNDIPVIVATSGILDNTDYVKINEEMLFTLGANEVVLKPVDSKHFTELIKNYL